MAMYMKNLKHKMTLRLTDELKEYVDEMSTLYSISPSDYIRQCIATQLDARRMAKNLIDQMGDKAISIADKKTKNKEVLDNGTDRKTDKHDII